MPVRLVVNCGHNVGNSIISMKEVVQIDGAYLNPGPPLLNLFLTVVESDE